MPLRPRFGRATISGSKWHRLKMGALSHNCPQLAFFCHFRPVMAEASRAHRPFRPSTGIYLWKGEMRSVWKSAQAAIRSSHCHTSQMTVKQALRAFGAGVLPKLFGTDGGSLRMLLSSFTERGHHECTEATFPCGSLSRVEWPLRAVVLGCRPARLKGTTT